MPSIETFHYRTDKELEPYIGKKIRFRTYSGEVFVDTLIKKGHYLSFKSSNLAANSIRVEFPELTLDEKRLTPVL